MKRKFQKSPFLSLRLSAKSVGQATRFAFPFHLKMVHIYLEAVHSANAGIRQVEHGDEQYD